LTGRAPFYSKAQLSVNTSAQPLDATFELLRQTVRQGLHIQA
jgi:XRE family aerobic/anaerobic benzoate catabolism transcriptional regulator